MKPKQTKKKVESIEIIKVADFSCAIYQNVVNITTALAQAGRFVNIKNTSSGYCVSVYERIKN